MSETKSPLTADAAAFAKARADEATPEAPATAETSTTKTKPAAVRRAKAAAQKAARAEAAEETKKLRRLVPAESCFDLLDGEYRKTRTGRMLSVVSLGVCALALFLVLGQFTRVSLEGAAVRGNIANLNTTIAGRITQLNTLSNFDGIDGVDIIDFVENRSAEAALAVEAQPNLAAMLSDLTASLPSGATITQFEMSPLSVPSRAESERAEGEGNATKPTHTITVTALVEDYDDVQVFIEALQRVEGFENVLATWTGQVGDIRVSASVDVPAGTSSRFAEFTVDAGIDEASASPEAEVSGTAAANSATPAEGSDG